MSSLAISNPQIENVEVKINDAGLGLEKTLAKVDLKAAPAVFDEVSSTASFSNTSFTTLDTLDKPKGFRIFSEADKELLRPQLTLIKDYDPFVANNGCFIPLIEARGGTDKDATGHRRDSIPIATQIAEQPSAHTCLVYFLDHTVDALASKTNAALARFLLETASVLVVRVNPGTLSSSAQAQLDNMLGELANNGVRVMTHPDTIRLMGAKDSLTKIRDLECGLPDTEVYYTADAFAEGFRKSIVHHARVIKQNRGSQGEGIWICKLKGDEINLLADGTVIASLDAVVELTEANDNHVEYHTVGEFLSFCIDGRTDGDCVWESSGTGRYLEGGIDAGAMLVNQRFLPRIVEGEIRCLMVGDNLLSIVHKKPSEGGVSATLQSGAVYTTYEPDHPKFEALVKSFRADLPRIMEAFGLEKEPLPLLWTADFILDYDEDGNDCYYVGEFNCSCVGITKDLQLAQDVAKVAVACAWKPKR